jgi:uncharacterized protein with HEPN domain
MSKRKRKSCESACSIVKGETTDRTNEQRLDDMLQFTTEITEWATAHESRKTRDAALTRDASIYLLGVIGVAATGMTEAFRAARPSIPWEETLAMQAFIGQPDRLLDHEAVERALHTTVPVLLRELTKLKESTC